MGGRARLTNPLRILWILQYSHESSDSWTNNVTCKGLRPTHCWLFQDFNIYVILAIRDVELWHNSHFQTRNYTTKWRAWAPILLRTQAGVCPSFWPRLHSVNFILSIFNTVHKIYTDTVHLMTHIHCPYIHYRTIFPCTCSSLSHTMAAWCFRGGNTDTEWHHKHTWWAS